MKTSLFLWVQLTALALCQPAFAAKKAESTMQRLLRVTGISAMPGLRGDDDVFEAGGIWVAAIAGGEAVRWTLAGGFRSPVFDAAGTAVYAMRNDDLVRIDGAGMAPVGVLKVPGVAKLIGFDNGAPGDLIVLTTSRAAPLALLSLSTGRLAILPIDRSAVAQQRLLAQVSGQSRVTEAFRVLVEKRDRQDIARVFEWTDIVVHDASGTARNLSNCQGVNCSQPALSSDLSRLVFVKAGD